MCVYFECKLRCGLSLGLLFLCECRSQIGFNEERRHDKRCSLACLDSFFVGIVIHSKKMNAQCILFPYIHKGLNSGFIWQLFVNALRHIPEVCTCIKKKEMFTDSGRIQTYIRANFYSIGLLINRVILSNYTTFQERGHLISCKCRPAILFTIS